MPDQEETGFRLAGEPSHEMRRPRQIRLLSQILISALIGLAVIYAFIFIPLPYYTITPGSADDLHPMVHMQGGYPERGVFMLTTVSVMDTNLSTFVWGKLTRQEMRPKSDFQQNGESEKEYTQRQEYIMTTSQSSAIQAAYRKAGIAYHIQDDGVTVLQTIKGMPAAEVLRAGDLIVGLDNTPIKLHGELLQGLQGKKEGDVVSITYKRGDETKTASIQLGLLPPEQGEQQHAGLGIVTGEVQSIQADDPKDQVTIDAGNIGGPSAGLMFSLEVYNRLTPEDITKGYRIAGTGEITPEGDVDVIGGIQHKVVAADREHADIFFAPNDYVPKDGTPILNASDAQKQAQNIHTHMKIVPVGTIDDALHYLASLPPKPAQ